MADVQTNHDLLISVREFLRIQLMDRVASSTVTTAWDEFFAIYDAMIRRFALAAGVRGDELDECVQNVWVSVLEHLDSFEVDSQRGRFRTWLYTIVRSRATDQIRRRSRRPKPLHGAGDGLADESQGDVADRLDTLWERELFAVLLADLAKKVTKESFAIFESHLVKGESYEQIAKRFGLTPATTRVRYHRTLKEFRDLCERYTARMV